MIKSMTAFANKEINNGNIQLSWEIRSVNHRYLDASVYLPEGFHGKDAELKDLIRKKLGRGKVDAKLVCNLLGDAQKSEIKLNQSMLDSLFEAQTRIELSAKDSSSAVTPLSVIDILNYPMVQESNELDYSQYHKAVSILFKDVLNILVESREEEGHSNCGAS